MCHKESSALGAPLQLKVFIAGRNRLENDGATALAQAFQVLNHMRIDPELQSFRIIMVIFLIFINLGLKIYLIDDLCH